MYSPNNPLVPCDDGHEHAWDRSGPKDICALCGIYFAEYARGFGSNVQPRKAA